MAQVLQPRMLSQGSLLAGGRCREVDQKILQFKKVNHLRCGLKLCCYQMPKLDSGWWVSVLWKSVETCCSGYAQIDLRQYVARLFLENWRFSAMKRLGEKCSFRVHPLVTPRSVYGVIVMPFCITYLSNHTWSQLP